MVRLWSTTTLGLASTLVIVHVAAYPLLHGAHQRRAVDVAALIHNQDRPVAPAPQVTSPLDARAVNLEGFVPYMHSPTPIAQPSIDKRALNLRHYEPYLHDSESLIETRYYTGERVPFPRPVPQQQDGTGESSEGNENGRKRDDNPILDNLERKPVDVVPIVGRAVDLASLNEEGRQLVDEVPKVGRAVDPTVSENLHRKPVDVVPIVGRAVDPTVSENIHRKPVDRVPIVGRAVDVEALTSLLRTCGPEATKYDPSQEFCDGQGIIRPLGSSISSSPAVDPTQVADKRNALPEADTDKMTCNGQRYLPSQQNCTANGSLVNIKPITPHNSKAPPSDATPPSKRIIAQCGSGIGSVQYDRATEYCNPITQQVWPLDTNLGSSRMLVKKPSLIPSALRKRATARCGSGSDSVEYDPGTENCDPTTLEIRPVLDPSLPAAEALSPEPALVLPGMTKRTTARCGYGGNGVEYDPATQFCDPGTGQVLLDEDTSNPASRTVLPRQALAPGDTPESETLTGGFPSRLKRDQSMSEGKFPFWEYWYEETYDSDDDSDMDA